MKKNSVSDKVIRGEGKLSFTDKVYLKTSPFTLIFRLKEKTLT